MAWILTLFSCVLVLLPICYSQENLAINKPAYQSGDDYGRGADKAVDGDSSGVLTNCAHLRAPPGTNTWWFVDLQDIYKVQRVHIYYRRDGGIALGRKFSRLSIGPSLSDLKTCRESGGVQPRSHEDIYCDHVGQFVQWERTGGRHSDRFTLCEVQVYGSKWSRNVALTKFADQSGIWGGRSPDRAVDGVTSGVDTHCATTDATGGTNAWWVVDLEVVYKIQKITVYFRGDNEAAFRRKDSRLRVGPTHSSLRTCVEFDSDMAPDPGYFVCNMDGRFVRWEKTGGRQPSKFTLCEVEVYGHK